MDLKKAVFYDILGCDLFITAVWLGMHIDPSRLWHFIGRSNFIHSVYYITLRKGHPNFELSTLLAWGEGDGICHNGINLLYFL